MCAGTYACQSLLEERRRCRAVRRKRPRERCPRQRRETPGSPRAPKAERKALRMHQGENATKLTIFVLRRECEHALPIFTLENTKPSGMVVNEAVRMSGHEVIPSRIRFEIDFYDSHERAFRHCVRRLGTRTRRGGHIHESPYRVRLGVWASPRDARRRTRGDDPFSTAASQSRGSSGG